LTNPTSNYGFVLPTSTDLVTDLPADFDVALQGVDTRLKALQPGTTLGDIAYSSATANTNTRLAIGSTGNVLTVAGGVPTWAAPAGGGKVLQVVQGTTSTPAVNSTTTFATTNVTASITPTLSTSKVLVMTAIGGVRKGAGVINNAGMFRLVRGATVIAAKAANYVAFNDLAQVMVVSFAYHYLDSPATTSATTYTMEFKNLVNSADVQCQYDNDNSTIILMEIGA
jgi:hypothetical protein